MKTIEAPRPASTVIVLRDRPTSDGHCTIETFMVKRHSSSAFLAGAYVFPGGRVDDADETSADQSLCDGIPDAVIHFSDLNPREAIGFHIAAIRELFEEAGILLARSFSGAFISFEDADIRKKFKTHRKAVHKGRDSLARVLRTEGLRLALDALLPYAHWVTPEIEGHRFDTRFFITQLPEGQGAIHDNKETVKSVWIPPIRALEAYRAGEFDLAPPTILTLEELTPFNTVLDALSYAVTKPIARIEPKVAEFERSRILVLPGDPLYPVPPDEAVSGHTRFVEKDGRWHAIVP